MGSRSPQGRAAREQVLVSGEGFLVGLLTKEGFGSVVGGGGSTSQTNVICQELVTWVATAHLGTL